MSKNKMISRLLEEVIKPISDLDYQKRVWVSGEGPECDSFDETINDFFYFYEGFEDLQNKYQIYGLSKKEYLMLKSLFEKLTKYCKQTPSPSNDNEIVKDPKWRSICNLAKEVYIKFKKPA